MIYNSYGISAPVLARPVKSVPIRKDGEFPLNVILVYNILHKLRSKLHHHLHAMLLVGLNIYL